MVVTRSARLINYYVAAQGTIARVSPRPIRREKGHHPPCGSAPHGRPRALEAGPAGAARTLHFPARRAGLGFLVFLFVGPLSLLVVTTFYFDLVIVSLIVCVQDKLVNRTVCFCFIVLIVLLLVPTGKKHEKVSNKVVLQDNHKI